MARQKPLDKLEALRKQREQIDAQLRDLEARQKEADRKADTRRKVIAGALAIEHMEANEKTEFGKVMLKLLDEYVTRSADRALFPKLAAKPASKETKETPATVADTFK